MSKGLESLVGPGEGIGEGVPIISSADLVPHSFDTAQHRYSTNGKYAALIGLFGSAASRARISRRGFLKGTGATVGLGLAGAHLNGCVTYAGHVENRPWQVLSESDEDRSGQGHIINDARRHLERAPQYRTGIDLRDGKAHAEVTSPVFGWVTYVHIDREKRESWVEMVTDLEQFLTVVGLDNILVSPDTFVTPGTIIGTEGQEHKHAQRLGLADPSTHLDVSLHKSFGGGIQKYTEGISDIVREVHNPHRHSITGRVETSLYNGKIVTPEQMTQGYRGKLVSIGRKYDKDHLGQLILTMSSLAGPLKLRDAQLFLMVVKAMEFGLAEKNPDLKRDLIEFFKSLGAEKAGVHLIYKNPNFSEYVEGKKNPNWRAGVSEIAKEINAAYPNAAKILKLAETYKERSPVAADVMRLNHVARGFFNYPMEAIGFWYTALGQADVRFNYPREVRERFYSIVHLELPILYKRLDMPQEAAYFEANGTNLLPRFK